jgi:hypothetical protein
LGVHNLKIEHVLRNVALKSVKFALGSPNFENGESFAYFFYFLRKQLQCAIPHEQQKPFSPLQQKLPEKFRFPVHKTPLFSIYSTVTTAKTITNSQST